ncbi:PA0069 family radical SAM protein [Rhodophyticola porphyridii]|uniref:PA0069 family radical SAM protein n=1 Tax=Rhodophyticola porphyridii TaxID=1852017 RepID=A0A3L9Y0K0_9RHOB|nr:PA0069 family radical SAM protein [Rhodophyticola porphyridii]RMA40738.1 PA0069 family radical SAM protein [Rhodophyticola porphyridii]
METDPILSPDRRKGRGAASNRTGRFERFERTGFSDGWAEEEALPPLKAEVREELAKSIITRNTSPDIPFDRSINPYRGCEHGCIYCFARPSHAYWGLSPGLDFETRLTAKPNAPELLEAELRNPRYRPRVIAIGTNTDPYQPIERDRRIMRGVLEVLQAFQHPVGIVTKGTLVERDADILGPMGQAGLARVGISITTLDRGLARKMEPRVPSPARRLRAIEVLSRAGCEVRVMVSPIVPGLTDPEIEAILTAARDAGAVAASFVALRLPREVSPLWRDWLEEHYPARFNRVMEKIREMHGGRDYCSDWGKRMTGTGTYAELIRARFRRASRALGLDRDLPPLRTDLFCPPPAKGDQLSLL